MNEQFVSVKPATKRGNAEPEILINLRYVFMIRPPIEDEAGTCTFIAFDGDKLETWEAIEKFTP